MLPKLTRRGILKRLATGSIALGTSGTIYSVARAGAQPQTPSSATSPIHAVRASLANGFIVHAGATSMELYHEHPHLQREEVVQPEDIRLQTRLVMRNHKEILDWLGLGWRNIVKLTCYQERMDESQQVQEVLASYFRDWRPAITTVEINGLSSPQARLEIDMWVVPDKPIVTIRTGNVDGIEEIYPRPEVKNRVAYALGAKVSNDMDLVFFSGVTAYPFETDPWNPGTFRLPTEASAQGKMATSHVDAVLSAAGITPQHILLSATYTAEPGAGINFGQRSANWRAPGTALQVIDTGVPGAKMLRQLTAAAPRKTQPFSGPVPGIEPILTRADLALKDVPAAPAIRVSSAVDLVFFSGITVYPTQVDPWNPGTFSVSGDVETQEKIAVDIIDGALKAAGITWQHVILISRVGEASSGNYLQQKLGGWRPCRVTRVLSTGIPGAKVMYEITAVAPRRA